MNTIDFILTSSAQLENNTDDCLETTKLYTNANVLRINSTFFGGKRRRFLLRIIQRFIIKLTHLLVRRNICPQQIIFFSIFNLTRCCAFVLTNFNSIFLIAHFGNIKLN